MRRLRLNPEALSRANTTSRTKAGTQNPNRRGDIRAHGEPRRGEQKTVAARRRNEKLVVQKGGGKKRRHMFGPHTPGPFTP